MLSMVFLGVYIPVVFVASWVIDKRGLHTGLIVGGLLSIVGAGIRAIARDDIISNEKFLFWILMGGQANEELDAFILLSL
jgi:fucose permease